MADTSVAGAVESAAKDEINKALNQAMMTFQAIDSPQDFNSNKSDSNTEGSNLNTARLLGENVVFEEVPLYEEPLQDPYGKAIQYLEKHDILQLFQTLTTNIVYRKPDDPLSYMMKEVEKMKKAKEKEAKANKN